MIHCLHRTRFMLAYAQPFPILAVWPTVVHSQTDYSAQHVQTSLFISKLSIRSRCGIWLMNNHMRIWFDVNGEFCCDTRKFVSSVLCDRTKWRSYKCERSNQYRTKFRNNWLRLISQYHDHGHGQNLFSTKNWKNCRLIRHQLKWDRQMLDRIFVRRNKNEMIRAIVQLLVTFAFAFVTRFRLLLQPLDTRLVRHELPMQTDSIRIAFRCALRISCTKRQSIAVDRVISFYFCRICCCCCVPCICDCHFLIWFITFTVRFKPNVKCYQMISSLFGHDRSHT